MEVSFTIHSHIIGRGGQNINTIMKQTSTKVHFPDGNRIAGEKKSNTGISIDTLHYAFKRFIQQLLASLQISGQHSIALDFKCVSMMDSSSNNENCNNYVCLLERLKWAISVRWFSNSICRGRLININLERLNNH